MKVDKELIKKVAEVSRLNLTDEEIKEFVVEIKDVLEHFSQIDKCDTKNTKPSFQPVEIKNALREDKKGECLTQEKATENSNNKKDGYFKGPKAV